MKAVATQFCLKNEIKYLSFYYTIYNESCFACHECNKTKKYALRCAVNGYCCILGEIILKEASHSSTETPLTLVLLNLIYFEVETFRREILLINYLENYK